MIRMSLARRLDLILENDTTQVADDPYQAAMTIATDLEEARRKVTDLERQLLYAVDRLCGGLAMGVRQHKPGLNVGLEGGCCKVGYKSRNLMMKPDLTKKVWVVNSSNPRFARRFTRHHGPQMGLINDLAPIAQAIANFFTGHYKTLGEEIKGNGLILLEGRYVRVDELVDYVKQRDDLLIEVNI